jgi:NADPH-dependent 2,4-dienoyl-CoA reductase/sulfur reductase-like enzyme
MSPSNYQVAIVGAGPGGLAVATELRRLGVERVVVIERESAAGGIPRHCGHSPFGMREFHRPLRGPEYARRLAGRAVELGVELKLSTTVTGIGRQGRLELSSDLGREEIAARRVVVATGNRETPRSARIVSGTRPLGVITTGALQLVTYQKQRLPFRRPVIVGSELVAFSALLTCRHFGIRPVAMLEPASRITAWRFAAILPRLLGTPMLCDTKLAAIHGDERVSGVEVRQAGSKSRHIDCDGVVFSGNFVAESSLVRASHLQLDATGNGPLVDQYFRCSDADYFACGNLLHPVDTAGWCWAEGLRLARVVKASLDDELPSLENAVTIACNSDEIKYFTPQRIVAPGEYRYAPAPCLQIRFVDNRRGSLLLRGSDRVLAQRRVNAHREQRILLPLPPAAELVDAGPLTLDFEPA